MFAHRADQWCEMITIVAPLAGGGSIYRSPNLGCTGRQRDRRVVLHLNGIAPPFEATTGRHCSTCGGGIGYQFLVGDLNKVVAEHGAPMGHQSGVGREVAGEFHEIAKQVSSGERDTDIKRASGSARRMAPKYR